MKEASGELSMTAVAVVAIAAIGVLFTTLIYPGIKKSLENRQKCSTAYACNCGDSNDQDVCNCHYEGGSDTIECPNPNANVD